MSYFLGLTHMFQEKVTTISCVSLKGLEITHYILGKGKNYYLALFLTSTKIGPWKITFFFSKNDINLFTSPNSWLEVEAQTGAAKRWGNINISI